MGLAEIVLLKQQQAVKERQLATLKTRRTQVKAVIASIENEFSDNANEVNRKISASCRSLEAGVTGISQGRTASSSLTANKEKYADTNLFECRDMLVAERRRLDTQISDLEYQIDRLDMRIQEEKDEMAENI